MEPEEPLTAGEWQRRTHVERSIAAFFFLLYAMTGLTGSLSAIFVFVPGELTGTALSDGTVLCAVLGTSALALRQGLYLLQNPVCRVCRSPLTEHQFRCSKCAALVGQPIRTRT